MHQGAGQHPEGEFHFYHGRQVAEMFGYESEGLGRVLKRVRASVVPGFALRKAATRDVADSYGVKAVLFTAQKPAT